VKNLCAVDHAHTVDPQCVLTAACLVG